MTELRAPILLCFADLAALAIHLIGSGEYERQRSTETWDLAINGVDIKFTVFHESDAWTFRTDSWLLYFVYTPFVDQKNPTETDRSNPGTQVCFGSQGHAHTLLYQGDLNVIEKHLMLCKVVIEPYRDIPETHGVFVHTDVLP